MTTISTERATVRIREMVRIRIEGEDEISLSGMTDAIVALLAGDTDWLRMFAMERLRSSVYAQVQEAVARTRMNVIGDYAANTEAIEKRAQVFSQRFLNWYEHAGDRHVRVMDMTREDLLLAASERRRRGDTEHRRAALWTRIAGQLEGGQKVGDRFTAEQLDTMYAEIATEGASN